MLKNAMQAELHICRPDMVPRLPVTDLCLWPSGRKATKAKAPLAPDGMEVGCRGGMSRTPKSTGKKGIILLYPQKGRDCPNFWFSPAILAGGEVCGFRPGSLLVTQALRLLWAWPHSGGSAHQEALPLSPFSARSTADSLIGPCGHQSPPLRRFWPMTRLGDSG